MSFKFSWRSDATWCWKAVATTSDQFNLARRSALMRAAVTSSRHVRAQHRINSSSGRNSFPRLESTLMARVILAGFLIFRSGKIGPRAKTCRLRLAKDGRSIGAGAWKIVIF